MISVIIPTYNEANSIVPTIAHAQENTEGDDIEYIVIDSSPDDATITTARSCASTTAYPAIISGRGNQMNQGAAIATGDILLFLHADTLLPAQWDKLVARALDNKHYGGFTKQFTEKGLPLFDTVGLFLVQTFSNIKVYLGYEYLGDNAIFIRKDVFKQIKGYREGTLMEDVAFSDNMRQNKSLHGSVITKPVLTSARRFLDKGVFTTAYRMAQVRRAYRKGAPGEELMKIYNK